MNHLRYSAEHEIAKRATKTARLTLLEDYPTLVASVFSYGAVYVRPELLVVWVLLLGDPNLVPPWCFDLQTVDVMVYEIKPELSTMQAIIRSEFQLAGWPNVNDIRIGFDSAERVSVGGGRSYFQ